MLKSLKSTGKAAVILPHGVLFRGGAEGDIRTRILKQGFIKGIIDCLPTCSTASASPPAYIVPDKEGAAGRKGIFTGDASKGFIKDGNKNRLARAGHPQDREQLEAERDALTRQLEELDEEHGGEAYADLSEQEAVASKRVKDAARALDAKVAAQYKQLKPDDIKQLVVHDKWLASLSQPVQGELDRVSQALTGRIKQLAERYETPPRWSMAWPACARASRCATVCCARCMST